MLTNIDPQKKKFAFWKWKSLTEVYRDKYKFIAR
jgi:hypothetical protein